MTATLENLLIGTNEAASLCGLSRAAWYKARASGKIPRPVKIGGAVRWRRQELEDWIAAGCPARSVWDSMNLKK